MLSTRNLLLPSNGEPMVAPTLDMVLGCYYLTARAAAGEGREDQRISACAGAMYAHDLGIIKLQQDQGQHPVLEAAVDLQATHRRAMPRDGAMNDAPARRHAGRLDGDDVRDEMPQSTTATMYNEVRPDGRGGRSRQPGRAAIQRHPARRRRSAITRRWFINKRMDRKMLKQVVADATTCSATSRRPRSSTTSSTSGFDYATQSGITIAINDMRVPEEKAKLSRMPSTASTRSKRVQMGLITERGALRRDCDVWSKTTEDVKRTIQEQPEPLRLGLHHGDLGGEG